MCIRDRIIFLLLPDVDIAISKSPFFPIASICLEKIWSKPKSFAIAVKLDGLDANEIDGNAFLSFSNFPTISEDICILSLALPPLPHNNIVLPFFIVFSAKEQISSIQWTSFNKSFVVLILSFIIFLISIKDKS